MTTHPASPSPFYWRAFVSLIVVAAFAILSVTGIALYATPPGRIANWSGWTLLGVTKAHWQAVHMTFGFLFLFAAAFHLFFNWKVLLHYLRTRTRDGLRRRRELAWASAATLALVILTATDVPPVSYIAVGRESLANSWSSTSVEPPVPHAELMTLAQVAASLRVPLEDVQARLGTRGITASPETTLEVIASSLAITPRDLYALLRPAASTPPVAGAGMGWKTLAQVSTELGLSVDTARARLSAAGIHAGPEDTLKDIAQRHDRHTPDLFQVLAADPH